jgi:hypothetical protein
MNKKPFKFFQKKLENKPVYYEPASNNLYGDDNTTTVTEEKLTVVGKILQGEHRVRNL